MKKITILIADDHALIRETWRFLLNAVPQFKVIAESDSGEETVKLASRLTPDIVMMDINLNGMNGIIATPLIRKTSPSSKVLALSMYKQASYVKQMMNAGAMGYVTKDSNAAELEMAIFKLHDGDKYICDEACHYLAEEVLGGNKLDALTKKEIQITEHVKKRRIFERYR
ncbi:MAG: response regulator transcription factor [Bacteroidota bacterium]